MKSACWELFRADQIADPAEVGLGQIPGQPGLVQALEGVPVQARQIGDLLDRQEGQQDLDVLAQPVGETRSGRQPGQGFPPDTAGDAPYPAYRHRQPDPVLEQVPVADAAYGGVMDQGAGAPAARATGGHLRIGNQVNLALGVGERNEPGGDKAFPAGPGERSIAHGGSVLVWLFGRTNNLTRITVRPYLFTPSDSFWFLNPDLARDAEGHCLAAQGATPFRDP